MLCYLIFLSLSYISSTLILIACLPIIYNFHYLKNNNYYKIYKFLLFFFSSSPFKVSVLAHTHLVMSHWLFSPYSILFTLHFHLGGWRDKFLERHLPWASSTKATWMDCWHWGQTNDECTAFVGFNLTFFLFLYFFYVTHNTFSWISIWDSFFTSLSNSSTFFFFIIFHPGLCLKGKKLEST